MAIMNAIGIVLAMVVFFGIVWWAFSSKRKQANEEAANCRLTCPMRASPRRSAKIAR